MHLNEVNKVNMVIRAARYRYPATSEEVNDTNDEIYGALVDLLGYRDNAGAIAVSGELRELWEDVDDDRGDTFGATASGVADAMTYSSGVFGNRLTRGYDIYDSTMAILDNGVG